MDPYHIGNLDHHLTDSLIQNVPDHNDAAAQSTIINDFLHDTGRHVSVEDAKYLGVANGWFHPGDHTGVQDAGHLLDAYGIPNHHVENATVEQLVGELQAGHQAIIGLGDHHGGAPSSTWQDFFHYVQNGLGLGGQDGVKDLHAVTVKGIDKSDPAHPHILLHDPTKADGATLAYPLDKFANLCKDGFSYVATDTAPGGTAPQHHEHHFLSPLLSVGAMALSQHMGASPEVSLTIGRTVDVLTDKAWDAILSRI